MYVICFVLQREKRGFGSSENEFSGLIHDDALFGAVLAGPGEFVVLLLGACMCYMEVRYFSGWISDLDSNPTMFSRSSE